MKKLFLLLIVFLLPYAASATPTVSTATSTNDGTVYHSGGTYASNRDATVGSATITGDIRVGQAYNSPDYEVHRGFLSFAIPKMYAISSATLYVYGEADFSTTDFTLNAVNASAYLPTLTTADFKNFTGWAASGSYVGFTPFTNNWSSASYSAGWISLTVNAAGLAAILAAQNNTLGIALISQEDVNNSTPTTEERVFFYSSASADKAPHLEITYSAPPTNTTNVYYSVGRSAWNHRIGTPTVTINGTTGLATFSTAQTASSTGIGDRVTYGGAIAYIASKASTDMTQWNLITATGDIPAATTSAPVASIIHEYTSLSAAQTGSYNATHLNLSTKDLVAGNFVLNFPCYNDDRANTTVLGISGWNTDATHYIRIYTPYNTTTEVNQTQRHSGKYDATKWRDEVSGAYTISINSATVYLDGLQLQSTHNGNGFTSVVYIEASTTATAATAPAVYISNSIIKGVFTGTANNWAGINTGWASTGYNKLRVWNNIIYNIINTDTPTVTLWAIYIEQTFDTVLYNNTVYNCENGYGSYALNKGIAAKNNIAYNIAGIAWYGSASFTAASSTNNLSGPTSTTTVGSNAQNGVTVSFVDAHTATSTIPDFHLTSSDVGATGYGATLSSDPSGLLSFVNDIDNQIRIAPWNIGADEQRYVSPIILNKNVIFKRNVIFK